MPKMKKPKKATVCPIPRQDDLLSDLATGWIYEMLEKLIDDHHDELKPYAFGLAWRFGWKPDPDGLLKAGQARKLPELERRLTGLDGIILLNFEQWLASMQIVCPERVERMRCHVLGLKDVTSEALPSFATADSGARRIWCYLLDHELCHFAASLDNDLEPRVDETGLPQLRIRQHDVTDFVSVVERWGITDAMMARLYRTCEKADYQGKLFVDEDPGSWREEVHNGLRRAAQDLVDSIPSGHSVTIGTKGNEVTLEGQPSEVAA